MDNKKHAQSRKELHDLLLGLKSELEELHGITKKTKKNKKDD